MEYLLMDRQPAEIDVMKRDPVRGRPNWAAWQRCLDAMQGLFSAFLMAGALALTGCATPTSPSPNSTAAAAPVEAPRPALPPSQAGDGLDAGPLFDALALMDQALFDASFASCDAAKANAIFAEDVEFYHDKDGLSVGEKVRENTRRLTAFCPGAHGVKRSIVPGSLRVYPIAGYGAAQIGEHRFDERGAATSTLAKFISVWRLQDGRWRLARVLSLDHRAVPAPQVEAQPASRP